MSQEILYTSAPAGLRPGTRGFCTVVSTSGMATNLAERLESRSGYEHAYPAHDPRASQNPVNYSHCIFSLGGQKYHLLSRICDAGLDYSKRSNKLAHHVVLEPDELVVGGPAWVLAGDGFCETRWDGKTRLLPTGRKPRTDPAPIGVCHAWSALTGDAGWAGVLAESITTPLGKPISIIFRPGTDILPLVVEAISLLEPERRWSVTFATYFTQLQTNLDCHWRFLLDGGREARVVRRNPHAPLIDLCNPLDAPQGGRLVEAARTGELPQAMPQPVPVILSSRRSGVRRESIDNAEPNGLPPDVPAYELAPRESEASRILHSQFRPRRRLPVVALSCLVTALLAGFICASFYFLGTRWIDHTSSVNARKNDTGHAPQPDQEREKSPSESVATIHADDEGALNRRTVETATDPRQKDHSQANSLAASDEASSEPVESDGSPPPEKPDPLKDIYDHNKRLPLPDVDIPFFHGGAAKTKAVELAKIFVDSPQNCELKVIGSDRVLGAGNTFEAVDEDIEGQRIWKVYRSQKTGQPPQICTFTLRDQVLQFQWFDDSRAKQAQPELLRFCLLEVTVSGEESVRCILAGECMKVDPLAINLLQPSPHKLPMGIALMQPIDSLRVDLAFPQLPDDVDLDPKEIKGLKPSEKRKVSIFRAIASKKEKFVELEVEFNVESAAPELRVVGSGYSSRDGHPRPIRDLIRDSQDRDEKGRAKQIDAAEDLIKNFEKKIADIDASIRNIDQEVERANNQIEILNKVLSTAKDLGNDVENGKKQVETKLDIIRRKIDECKANRTKSNDERSKTEDAIKKAKEDCAQAKANYEWLEVLRKTVNELRGSGRIGYRVYFEIEEETVDILQTTSDF